MRELTPKTVDVLSVYLYSFGEARPWESKPQQRRAHLGLFDADTVSASSLKALEEKRDLIRPLLGTRSYMDKAPVSVRINQKTIEEGVIFENVEECLTYLRHDLTYQAICEGYRVQVNEHIIET